MNAATAFWDALSPHHATIEDNYLDIRSVRRMVHELREPVLVVGAGQGLILGELRKQGLQCDGVDFSPEMIRYAKSRRGLNLFEADARALPFGEGSYGTILYATGVIDFIADEQTIGAILKEGRRVVPASGPHFVAFYRVTPAPEEFLKTTGLLKNHILSQRECLRMNRLTPPQRVAWVANRTGRGYLAATGTMLWLAARCSLKEKRMTFAMQKMFRNLQDPEALINTASETVPYRNEAEIRNLFARLAIPIRQLQTFGSCFMVQI